MTESKRDKFKKAFLESALSSSIVGIPNIFRNDKTFLKIIWIFSLLTSSCYCFFAITLTFNSYFDWNVTTNIKVIHEIPTEFPAITICNLNPFVTDDALFFIDKIITDNQTYFNVSNIEQFSKYSSILKYYVLFITMDKNYTNEYRKSFGLSLNDLIIECTFGLSHNCNLDDFDWHYNIYYGNCYTFNNGRNSKGEAINIYNSSQAGFNYGLRLKLFLGDPSKINEIIQSSGIHVYVHNKTMKPRFEDGIDVTNGARTNIIINRIIENNLQYPYSDCVSDQNKLDSFEYYRAFNQLNKSYSQRECYDICLQNEIIRKCNCSVPFFINLPETKYCNNMIEISCARNTAENYSKDIHKKCFHLCPRECETISYRFSTSHSDFPTLSYGEYLRKQDKIKERFQSKINNSKIDSVNLTEISIDQLKKSIVAINIYYDELKYTIISQSEEMDVDDLLSSIGGTLGLFVGFSVLSFVEIIEVLLNLISIIVMDTKNKIKNETDK